MSALDFPSSPVNGQTFVDGPRTWTFNSFYGVWNITSEGIIGQTGFTGSIGFTGSKGSTTVSPSAPTSPINGDLWWNSETGVRYVFYTDGTSNQWVQDSAGVKGSTGFVGSQGITGFTGSQGITGFTGSQGITGFTGSFGITGFTGSFGPVAGSNTQLVYNNSGTAAGANVFFNNANGNVGIGTSSPSAKLNVAGDTIISGNADALQIGFNFYGTSQYNFYVDGAVDAARMTIRRGTTSVATFDTSGNVGIGVAPIADTRLYVRTAAITGTAYYADNGVNSGFKVLLGSNITSILNDFAQPLAFGTNNTENMRIMPTGNLGLGVVPSAWGSTYRMQQIGLTASVGGRTAASQAYLSANWYQDGTNNRYITTAPATQYQQDGGVHYWFTAPSGTAGNTISFTQAMTLDAGGDLKLTSSGANLYIQPSSPTNSALIRNINTGGTVYVGIDSGSGGLGGAYTANFWHSGNYAMVFATNNTERARITAAGNVGIGTSAPGRKLDITAIPYSANQLDGVRLEVAGVSSIRSEFLLGLDGGGTPFTSLRTGTDANSFMNFFTGPTERMRIDSAGKLLFATTSLSTYVANFNGTVGIYNGNGLFLQNGNNNAAAAIYNGGASSVSQIQFNTGGGEKMRITAAGDVGIGTTAPATGILANISIVNAGIFTTLRGTVSSTHNVAVTIGTAINDINVTYIVSCGVASADPTNYSAVSIVSAEQSVLRTTALQTAVNVVISVSGNSIRATQTSGVAQTIFFNILRVA